MADFLFEYIKKCCDNWTRSSKFSSLTRFSLMGSFFIPGLPIHQRIYQFLLNFVWNVQFPGQSKISIGSSRKTPRARSWNSLLCTWKPWHCDCPYVASQLHRALPMLFSLYRSSLFRGQDSGQVSHTKLQNQEWTLLLNTRPLVLPIYSSTNDEDMVPNLIHSTNTWHTVSTEIS